jgi:hypothetical protein
MLGGHFGLALEISRHNLDPVVQTARGRGTGIDEALGKPRETVIGREPELAVLRGLVSADAPTAILFTGAAGVGKTALWEAGIRFARKQGAYVLAAQPSDAEVHLPFAGLCDPFDGIDSATLAGLPAPQLRALEVALLRADPSSGPPACTHLRVCAVSRS